MMFWYKSWRNYYLFFFFTTGLCIPMACTYQVGDVPHPTQRPKRHYNLSLFSYFCFVVLFSAVVPVQDSSSFFLSMFLPILVHFRRIHRQIPEPYQIYTCLFLPQNPHPHRWCSLCLLTKVQNSSHSYELPDHVLPSLILLFHLLEPCLLSCRRL